MVTIIPLDSIEDGDKLISTDAPIELGEFELYAYYHGTVADNGLEEITSVSPSKTILPPEVTTETSPRRSEKLGTTNTDEQGISDAIPAEDGGGRCQSFHLPFLTLQCSFTSENLPCDYCKSKNIENPCVKLHAPKRRLTAESSKIPSAPLVPIEESLPADDIHVLNFVYSQRITINASFIHQMAIAFGRSIRSTPLRYAVVAYGYLAFPSPGRLEKFETYSGMASNALLRRIKTPELLQDADCYAAMLLAYSSMVKGAVNESIIHAGGCVSILQQLHRSRHTRPYSDLLAVFAPFMIDRTTSILKIAAQPFPDLDSISRPTYAERRRYYKLLCETGCPKAWLPGDTEATYNHLRGAMMVCLGGVKKIASLESDPSGNVDQIRMEREELLSYLHRKLDDRDFEQAFKVLRTDKSLSHIFEYIHIGCKSLELLLSIAETETVWKGINSNQSAFIGGEIYAAARRSGGPSAERYHHRDLYYCGIALAGMLLNPMSLSCGDVPWIIRVLEAALLEETVQKLKSYWAARSLDSLHELLGSVGNDWWTLGEKWR